MTAGLVRADSVRLPLRDDSVDLVVTSPPYFALRSYQDDGAHYAGQIGSEPTPAAFLAALWAVTAECARVLKPSGSIFVNLGDKYAGSGGHNNSGVGGTGRGPSNYNKASLAPDKSLMGLPWRYALGCVDQLGLIHRAEIIWSKPNAMPEPHTDRVRRTHEQFFHFTREPSYYASTDKKSHSVWHIATEPLHVPDELEVDHFAAFPQEWPRRLILGWCPPDGVVLDPFGGTGTTAMVARALGRFGVSIDLSADYLRLARWRVFESGHAVKAIDRTKADNQHPMFTS